MSKPEGYGTVTPYLMIRGAADAIEFYKKAFGAIEVSRESDGEGRIRHADIQVGDSHVMITDEFPQSPRRSVQSFGGLPMGMFLYVDNADAVADRALAAGAKLITEVRDQSYGRSGGVKDPYGIDWWVCS